MMQGCIIAHEAPPPRNILKKNNKIFGPSNDLKGELFHALSGPAGRGCEDGQGVGKVDRRAAFHMRRNKACGKVRWMGFWGKDKRHRLAAITSK
jgi:hypothetical protein